MNSLCLKLFVVFLLACGSSCNVTYPVGDVRNCPSVQSVSNAPLYRMEVLPGVGFDNLRNIDMSQVVQYNYSQCKTTNDGKYLLPDDIFVVPIQRSRLETYADLFQHWDNYTSMTSASINFDVSVYSIVSGKFGFEYQHVKQHQVNDDAKTTRVQIRHDLYKVILQPDSQLNPKFKNRLLDIAANIQSNNTLFSRYQSELLVRDYGTHIVRTVEAGALISQIDSVSSTYVADNEEDHTSITASASVNFMDKFSLGFSSGYSNGNIDQTKYITSRSHSLVQSVGGPPLRPNMTLEQWENGVPDALVAIDRSGDPLHYVITAESLPELPSPTLRELIDYVYKSIVMYYRVNTHYGCTSPSSPNFDYDANLNDGSCAAPRTNYSFGGVYQTCQVEDGYDYENLCTAGAETKNPLTGDYSCPDGYSAVELHSGTVTHVSKKEVCDKVCHHCGLFGWSRCCQCLSAWVNVLSAANYQAYWCVATGPVAPDHGYLFGGVYTSKSINPITHSMACPTHFYPLHIGEELEVCVSDQYDYAYEYSIPFGGFQSCRAGNPLATTGGATACLNASSKACPKACPKTFKQVLATVDEGCEINYCARFSGNNGIQYPKLPPFRSKPGLKKNLTQSLVIQGPYGDIWIRSDNGDWVKVDSNQVTGEELLEHLAGNSITPTTDPVSDTSKSVGISAGVSAGISVGVTFFVCTVIIVAIFGIYGLWRRRKFKRTRLPSVTVSRNYLSISEDETDTSPVVKEENNDA